jgi:hypothetical protein
MPAELPDISNLTFAELAELIRLCQERQDALRAHYLEGAAEMGLVLADEHVKKRGKRRANAAQKEA